MKNPWLTLPCLALLSCEGATYVNHRFTNATPDLLATIARLFKCRLKGYTPFGPKANLVRRLVGTILLDADVEEGLTLIRFNQNLRIVPSHFD